MKKRINNINEILKFFADIYSQNPNIKIDPMSIYYYLVKSNSIEGTIQPFHRKWINDFKDIPNIDVFVSEKWPYFCQFVNFDINNRVNNSVKLYVPVDYNHIDQAACDIFKFLANKNIKHESKIGSDERKDVIVIRLDNKDDLPILKDFIHNNKNISDGSIDNNPFVMNDGIIGYACDGNLSYNLVVACYIRNYFLEKRNKNEFNNVSYQDFFIYCSKIYNDVFVYGDPNKIESFRKKFGISVENNFDKYALILNNYGEVSKLLLNSLQTNDLSLYFQHINDVNDVVKISKSVNKIKFSLSYELSPIKNCIETMIRKHGYINAISNIEQYIKTGNSQFLTNDNDVRDIITNSYDLNTFNNYFHQIINSGTYTNEVSNKAKTNNSNTEIINDNFTNSNMQMDIMNLIDNSINCSIVKQTTFKDQEDFNTKKKAYFNIAVSEILNNNNFDFITRNNNSRMNMINVGSEAIRIELIKGAFVSYSTDLQRDGKVDLYKKNNIPSTPQEARNLVVKVLEKEGVDRCYQLLNQSPIIEQLLIQNYSNLLTTTTANQRKDASNQLVPFFKKQIEHLDQLQSQLIIDNQNKNRNYNKI